MLVALAAAAAIAGGGACQVAERKRSTMATEIWEVGDDQLKSAQAKITFLGEQEKPIPTIVFTVDGRKPSMVRFLTVQRSNRPYGNDELPYTKTFSVTIPEFRRILNAVRPVTANAAAEPNFLSFCIVTGAGNAVIGREYFIDKAHGRELFAALQSSISPNNTTAHSLLAAQVKNLYP
jgi:hypothetical protein